MRRLTLPMVMVVASLALGVPAAAQDAAHPAHIHEGVCPAPGAIVATLGEVTSDLITDGGPAAGPLPVGVAPTTPIMASVTTLDLPLATIVGSPHSIVVHASIADMGTYLACGTVGGRTMGDTRIPIALAPVGGSGYSGVAILDGANADSTVVSVYLVEAEAAQPGVSAPPEASSPPASAALAPTAVALDQPLQFSGYDIIVKEARYDPILGTLEVDATFGNTGTGTGNLVTVQLGGAPAIVWQGTSLPLTFRAPSPVPGGTIVPATLVTRAPPPDGFDLGEAVLTFGAADQHQATLPLRAGATGTYLPVQTFKVPKAARSLRVKGAVRVTIEIGEVDASDVRRTSPLGRIRGGTRHGDGAGAQRQDRGPRAPRRPDRIVCHGPRWHELGGRARDHRCGRG